MCDEYISRELQQIENVEQFVSNSCHLFIYLFWYIYDFEEL